MGSSKVRVLDTPGMARADQALPVDVDIVVVIHI